MSENNWLKKELASIERQRKGLIDQYNTEEKPKNQHDFDNIIHADLRFAPKEHQTWESYIKELKIYVDFADKKNTGAHINGVRGAWYTHRQSSGCFMCEDVNLRHVMLSVLQIMAKQHPTNIF